MNAVSTSQLSEAVTAYGTGLEAELGLLQQLQQLSLRQREISAQDDFEQIRRCTDERERLLSALLAVEEQLRHLRELLAAEQPRAAHIQGFAEVAAMHRVAGDLVGEIVASDQATMEALRVAETARHALARSLETGETTLAAYRRVVTPPSSSAALVDRRG